MKKFFLWVMTVICLFSLFGCTIKKSSTDPTAFFIAKITEVIDGRLFVEVTNSGSTALEVGTPVYVSTNFEGYTEHAAGEVIRVEFNTVIQESYPPIIPYVTSITPQQ